MARRIRAFDWSRTPLGPIVGWPEALVTAVDSCLASSHLALVWWGSDLINLYNDPEVPILGESHPSALGRPAREVWARAWPTLAADVEGVMTRGMPVIRERTLVEIDGGGRQGGRYFTYSLSPIWDGHGRIGGVFIVANDQTERVLADRHRDRAEMAILEAKAAAEASLVRWQSVIAGMREGVILADPAGHLLDWNRAALAIHGYEDVSDALVHLSDISSTFQLTTPRGDPLPFSRWPMSRLLAGEVFQDELIHLRRRATGIHQVLSYSGALIRDADGRVTLALLTLHEVAHDLAGLGRPFLKPAVVLPGESADERIERLADEAAENVESLLHEMDLSLGEREFCKAVGESLADQAIDAYVTSKRDSNDYDGSCIAASVAVALLIVREPA